MYRRISCVKGERPRIKGEKNSAQAPANGNESEISHDLMASPWSIPGRGYLPIVRSCGSMTVMSVTRVLPPGALLRGALPPWACSFPRGARQGLLLPRLRHGSGKWAILPVGTPLRATRKIYTLRCGPTEVPWTQIRAPLAANTRCRTGQSHQGPYLFLGE